jgi:cell division cycle 2-like protein
MNNRGEIKLADFGMARQFSDPPPSNLTRLVVTLWYRSPELLLGTETYGPAVDVWSLGCVLGELARKEPLLPGRSEADQLGRVFALVGAPTERSWPTWRRLPNARGLRLPAANKVPPSLRGMFPLLTAAGVDLLAALLALDPERRPTAAEVLAHDYFRTAPRPKAAALFPTFPSKAGGERRRPALESPTAPRGGEAPRITSLEAGVFAGSEGEEVGAGFALRMA